MLFVKPRLSHEARILQALKKAGRHGMYNHELSRGSIGSWDWRKYVSNLRKDGHNIQHVQISRTAHKYYLIKEDPLET